MENKKINQEQLQSLVNIYNNLLNIHTNGEEAFLYTDCMRSFKQILIQINEIKE